MTPALRTGILLLVAGLLSSCVTAGLVTRGLTEEQVDMAVRLIEARQGQGCLCLNGSAMPPAGSFDGSVIGSLGGPPVEVCAQICIRVRR